MKARKTFNDKSHDEVPGAELVVLEDVGRIEDVGR